MKKILFPMVALMMASMTFAQTIDELNAERQSLKSELSSKDAVKKAQAIEKKLDVLAPVGGTMSDLVDGITASLPAPLKESVTEPLKNLLGDKPSRIVAQPGKVNLSSVDGIIDGISPLLAISVSTSDILSEYKTEIIDSGNGEIDITKYKAKAADYIALLPMLVQAGVDAAKCAGQLKNVQGDLKKLNPMQAAPAIKAGKWAADAVDVTTAKLSETTKLLQNLVNTLNAAENL